MQMKKTWYLPKSRHVAVYGLLLFLLLALAYTPVAVMMQRSENTVHREEIENEQETLVQIEKTVLNYKFDRLASDVLYVSDSLHLLDTDGQRIRDLSTEDQDAIKRQWIAFANRKGIYSQIRYLDNRGNEVIRINYDTDGSYAVDTADLQNKGDEDYFSNTLTLQENQLYVSAMELNVENGQIEEPERPIIRISTPYYVNGQVRGSIILTYDASDMLQQIADVADSGLDDVYLLNGDGYWIYNKKDPDSTWGFMYADRTGDSFAARYPEEWQEVQAIEQKDKEASYQTVNQSLVTDNGAFNCLDIFSGTGSTRQKTSYQLIWGTGNFYAVTRISPESEYWVYFNENLKVDWRTLFLHNIATYTIMLFVAAGIAVFLAYRKEQKERIRYFSEFDTMTGAYNRRTGFERLQELYRQQQRSGRIFSICFMDVNGLKQVNDELGHECGDELLITVASVIRKQLRSGDVLVRLGGDEFLLICRGMDLVQTEELWKRIVAELEKINETEKRAYRISVSHGIEQTGPQNGMDPDEFVNAADTRMYEEKRMMKQTVQIIRK